MIIRVPRPDRIPAEVLTTSARPCHVRGGLLRAHLAWVEQRAGRDGLEAVAARVGETHGQPALSSIQDEDWLPFSRLIAVDRAIAQLFPGSQEDDVYAELGRFSAQRNFQPAGLDLSPGTSIHSHFWTGATHHATFQDFGTCSYSPLEARALRMDYRNYPVMSRVFCASAPGYFETSVTMLGGLDPIVKEATCQCYGDESCSFVISWEE